MEKIGAESMAVVQLQELLDFQSCIVIHVISLVGAGSCGFGFLSESIPTIATTSAPDTSNYMKSPFDNASYICHNLPQRRMHEETK
jgi:hypothetical protein